MIEHERTGVVDMVTWSFSRVAMWLPAFIVCIILYEVFNRYVLGSGTLWANELSLWVAGGVYLTAGLYAMQQRSHIRIFILYDLAPRWLRKTFDTIGVLCVVVFAGAVVYGGYNEAAAKFLRWERFGTAFDPPLPATMKPLILLLMVVLAVQAISNLIRDWPAAPWVRKAFDLFAYALIMFGVVFGSIKLLGLLGEGEGVPANNIPEVWIYAIVAFFATVGILATIGLKDWNRDPVVTEESHDPADEMEIDRVALGLEPEPGATVPPGAPGAVMPPDETLTGNPPIPGKKKHP